MAPHFIMARLPPEIKREIVKLSASSGTSRHIRVIAHISSDYLLLALRILYRVVELKSLAMAISFFDALRKAQTPAILRRHRSLTYAMPPLDHLVKKIYFSFDVGKNNLWAKYRDRFFPQLVARLPLMTNLTELSFNTYDSIPSQPSYPFLSPFNVMTHPAISYPLSLQLVWIISVDIDGRRRVLVPPSPLSIEV